MCVGGGMMQGMCACVCVGGGLLKGMVGRVLKGIEGEWSARGGKGRRRVKCGRRYKWREVGGAGRKEDERRVTNLICDITVGQRTEVDALTLKNNITGCI